MTRVDGLGAHVQDRDGRGRESAQPPADQDLADRLSEPARTLQRQRQVDQAQYDTGEGPCLETLFDQRTVRMPDIAAEQRWPRFRQRAEELGVGSVLGVRLYVEGDDLGALDLLSTVPSAFDGDAEHVALLFAAHSWSASG